MARGNATGADHLLYGRTKLRDPLRVSERTLAAAHRGERDALIEVLSRAKRPDLYFVKRLTETLVGEALKERGLTFYAEGAVEFRSAIERRIAEMLSASATSSQTRLALERFDPIQHVWIHGPRSVWETLSAVYRQRPERVSAIEVTLAAGPSEGAEILRESIAAGAAKLTGHCLEMGIEGLGLLPNSVKVGTGPSSEMLHLIDSDRGEALCSVQNNSAHLFEASWIVAEEEQRCEHCERILGDYWRKLGLFSQHAEGKICSRITILDKRDRELIEAGAVKGWLRRVSVDVAADQLGDMLAARRDHLPRQVVEGADLKVIVDPNDISHGYETARLRDDLAEAIETGAY